MKKKLVTLLAVAALTAPAVSVFATENGAVNTEAELNAVLTGPTPAEKAAAEKAAAEKAAAEKAAAEEAANKAFVETAVAEVEASKDAGVKLEDGTRVHSPNGEVVLDKAGVEEAKQEMKEETKEAAKPAAKAVAKAATKTAAKALPKTSAAK